MNSIAHLAEAVGADVDDVLASLAHDPRIGAHYLRPGPGYGGSCFPKDVRALVAAAAAHGHDLDLLRSVVDTNDAQFDRVVAKVAESVGGLDDAVVAMWGIAFKAETDDVRGSPAVAMAERMRDAGARVRAYDPAATETPPGVERASSALDAVEAADALLVATEWAEFAAVDPIALAGAMRGKAVIDARNLLDRDAITAAGLDYRGLGR